MATRMISVLAADIEPETGDVRLDLQADNGQTYGLRIARPIAALFVVTVVGQMQKSREKFRDSPDFQPATLTSVRKFFDLDGKPGLRLMLDDGLPLAVVMSPDDIPGLQNELRQLSELAAQPAKGKPSH